MSEIQKVDAEIAKVKREIADEYKKISSFQKSLMKAIADKEPADTLNVMETAASYSLTIWRDLNKYESDLVKSRTALIGGKNAKSIPFTKAQANDITAVTGINIKWKPYPELSLDDKIEPSGDFWAVLEKNNRVWSLNSEASRRTVIDIFLRDIVARDEFIQFRIFCELGMQAVDDSGEKSWPVMQTIQSTMRDSRLIVFEAKKDWPNDSHWQCIAEAATLCKTRKDNDKKNPRVWGILSNGSLFQFIHIDNDGQLYISTEYVSGIPAMCTRDSILKIYRIIHQITNLAYESSPTTTPVQSLQVSRESLVTEAED